VKRKGEGVEKGWKVFGIARRWPVWYNEIKITGVKEAWDVSTYRYKELSRFVLTRGLAVCALLLAGTVALLFRAGEGGMVSVRLYDYAEVFQLAALMAFGCATIGSLLMEDLLRYFGK